MSSRSPARPRRPTRPLLATLAFAGALAVIAGCGGSTSQRDPFQPQRLFAFGDEHSTLTTDAPAGRNYGINAINNNNTPDNAADDFLDCSLQPNWVQSLAGFWSFVFAECNPEKVAEPQARNFAAPRAKVADVAAQVDAQVAAGGFRDKDVATVMVGTNDIVELYQLYDGTNEGALIEEARARGVRAAQIVNRLIALGAKVFLANIPDVGLTPFAKAEREANTDTDRAALLSRLSAAFNERLGISIVIDGRFVALVQSDERILSMVRSPDSFAVTNVTDAVCTTPPPSCTNVTLAEGAGPGTHLWSSPLWLAPAGSSQLATRAATLAQRLPF
jgi:outer membrane lipase/esterase